MHYRTLNKFKEGDSCNRIKKMANILETNKEIVWEGLFSNIYSSRITENLEASNMNAFTEYCLAKNI